MSHSVDNNESLALLKVTLSEIADKNGAVAVERFASLRDVDAKIRDIRIILTTLDGLPLSLISDFGADPDFSANSRRVRLEAAANYLRSAVKFLGSVPTNPKKPTREPPPNYGPLTSSIPGLKEELDRRWYEVQSCLLVSAFTSAIILMGSILEGLLLARALKDTATTYRSTRAPRDKAGKSPAIHDWSLNNLIDVAIDIGWLKFDRGQFSHALRTSRNVIHPWNAIATNSSFDQATCTTSWHVLKSSAEDLVNSIP